MTTEDVSAVAAGLSLVVGAALRLVCYRSHGRLWGGEASIAISIASRSFAGLTRPLDFEQVAPIPFLWVDKVMTGVGAVNQYALRALPPVAGILSLALLWRVACRMIGSGAAASATILAACPTLLINYGAEVKQYSRDILATLALLWLFLHAVQQRGDRLVVSSRGSGATAGEVAF
jgi:hypothetical protein